MEDEKKTFTGMKENHIEGRNAVLEAFRSGRTIDKLYVLDGCQDGPVRSITREARKHDTIVNYVTKERLDQISETGKHQGVIAVSAAYDYARVEDILALAEKKGEPPFILILDGIEDPHNLGAIIRTANQAGAHGVIIPKRRAVGLTPTVARTSAGSKSDKYLQYHERTQRPRYVVCVCGYGWNLNVRYGSDRTDRSGDRK